MSNKTTTSLAAFFMDDMVKDALRWSPGLISFFRFGGLQSEFFRYIIVCLNAYIYGAALGYTFGNKYELLVSMMTNDDQVKEYADFLRNTVRSRIDSYDQEITSMVDFFVTTELAKCKMSFDDFLNKSKTKIKMEHMGPRIKLVFEEGVSIGASYPEMVEYLFSNERKTSNLDWEKAKILGNDFNINNLDLDLKFLVKWARYNLGQYFNNYFPEMVASLELGLKQ